MSITAQSVVRRVVNALQDIGSTRWVLNELVRYMNDGQREIVLYRPDASAVTANMTCVAGTRQTIPANGMKLLEVLRNNNGVSMKAPRIALREHLDAQLPGWHSVTPSSVIDHFMVDDRDPKVFYTYPPATVDAKLDIFYSQSPTPIAEPGDGTTLPVSSVNDDAAPDVVIGSLTVSDEFANALRDYMLYRAYLKDSASAGNMQRSVMHYQAFASAVGIEIKGRMYSGPTNNSPFNPTHPAIVPPVGA